MVVKLVQLIKFTVYQRTYKFWYFKKTSIHLNGGFYNLLILKIRLQPVLWVQQPLSRY